MSYPRWVYRSFYARDLKKTIYSEICRLYISLWSIQAGNDVVPATTFSPLATPVLYCSRSSRSVRIHWKYLFLLRPPFAFLSQQISCHRTGANRFWRVRGSDALSEINKSGKFELLPSFFSDLAISVIYILTNFMGKTNSTFASEFMHFLIW